MADFDINDCGSIVQFVPRTNEAVDWVDENLEVESWQYMGAAICLDHRMAQDVLIGIVTDGLTIGPM